MFKNTYIPCDILKIHIDANETSTILKPFLICLLHRKLTYPLKNSGSARQSCLSFSVLAPIFTVNIRSFSGEYTIWFPKPIGSMYGFTVYLPMYIYHKNQPTCRWIYHTWCLHGSYWKQNGFFRIFFPQQPHNTWDWSGCKLVLGLANVGGCPGKLVNFVGWRKCWEEHVGYLRIFI